MKELESILLSVPIDAYQTDNLNYGVADLWRMWKPETKGDCEDIALYHIAKAKEAGLKARLALCLLKYGGFHAVCICEVDGVDYVLDCRHRFVFKWNDPYLDVLRWLYEIDPDEGEGIQIDNQRDTDTVLTKGPCKAPKQLIEYRNHTNPLPW